MGTVLVLIGIFIVIIIFIVIFVILKKMIKKLNNLKFQDLPEKNIEDKKNEMNYAVNDNLELNQEIEEMPLPSSIRKESTNITDRTYRLNDLLVLISSLFLLVSLFVFFFGKYLSLSAVGMGEDIAFTDFIFSNKAITLLGKEVALKILAVVIAIFLLLSAQSGLFSINFSIRGTRKYKKKLYNRLNFISALLSLMLAVVCLVLYISTKNNENIAELSKSGVLVKMPGLITIIILSIIQTGLLSFSVFYASHPERNIPIGFMNKIYLRENNEAIQNKPKKDNNVSSVDGKIDFEQLEKLKDLLDRGIITQEDYDSKKKELLNL